MKKLFFAGLIVIALALALNSEKLVGFTINWKAHRTIYPQDSTISKYPGVGQISIQSEDKIWVVPKGVGRPKFDSILNKSVYDPSVYAVIDVPAQEQTLYVVGKFVRWERIANSLDKYMRVKVNGETKKYRIGFAPSKLYGSEEDVSYLALENVSSNEDNVNQVKNAEPASIAKIGYTKMKQIVRPGEVVILTPVFAPPELVKRDENGKMVVSWVMVRRLGGEL